MILHNYVKIQRSRIVIDCDIFDQGGTLLKILRRRRVSGGGRILNFQLHDGIFLSQNGGTNGPPRREI